MKQKISIKPIYKGNQEASVKAFPKGNPTRSNLQRLLNEANFGQAHLQGESSRDFRRKQILSKSYLKKQSSRGFYE